jgi:hypothetical protein
MSKSFVEKYKYIEKENNWKDPESFKSQTHLVGGMSLDNITTVPKALENYGIPAGLVVIPPNKFYYDGGSKERTSNKSEEIARLITEEEHNSLEKLINVYKKNLIKIRDNKTRKKK